MSGVIADRCFTVLHTSANALRSTENDSNFEAKSVCDTRVEGKNEDCGDASGALNYRSHGPGLAVIIVEFVGVVAEALVQEAKGVDVERVS